jgi:hypothetical protein
MALYKPTELCDVRNWNYGKFAPNHFDIIWASPPCTEFSRLKTTGVRNIPDASEIVKCALEIIDYFQPKAWFLENPATGLLPEQPFMRGLPFYDVDYCKYSNFGYRKRTRIWTNIKGLKMMTCNKDCGFMDNNKHINTFGGMKSATLDEKHRVPDMLLHKLVGWVFANRME